MKNGYLLPGFLILLVVAVFQVFIGQGILLAAEKLTVASPVKGSPPTNLPPQAAIELGFWKQEGLDVEWIPFKGGAEFHRAVAAGAVDLGVTTTLSLIQAVVGGVKEVIVADLVSGDDTCIWVPAGSPIRRPSDLKGAIIGAGRTGEMTHALGLVMARGVGLEKEIKFVAGGGVTEELAAMKTGTIHGRVGPATMHVPLKLRGEIRDILCASPYLPKEWAERVVFIRKGFLEKNPGAVARGVRVLLRATNYLMDNPQWVIEKLKGPDYMYSEAAAREIIKLMRFTRNGKLSRQALQNFIDFAVGSGVIPKAKAPVVEDIYTAQFTS